MSKKEQSVSLEKKTKIFEFKILDVTEMVQPFLISLTFTFLIIETFTYSGFISKHIFFDVKLFMLLSILSMSISLFGKAKNGIDNSLTTLLVKCSYLTLPIFFVLYYIMLAVEATNYPNYLYSSIHVNSDNFFNALVFNTLITLYGFLNNYVLGYSRLSSTKFNGSNSRKHFLLGIQGKKTQYFLYAALALLLGYYILTNVILTTSRMVKSNIYVVFNMTDNYDMKMYNSWHFFYKYMKFVNENTPSDAYVAIPPPIRPWLSEGNSVLVRYFLYPRYIVTVEDETGSTIAPQYYIISKGLWKARDESEYGWPREKIYAEKIIYLNENDFSTRTVYDVLYDPVDPINKMGWGLIKVDKNRKYIEK